MQVPKTTASVEAKVSWGRYSATRAKRAKEGDIADQMNAVTQQLLVSERAFEDIQFVLQEANAERDASDGDYDDLVRLVEKNIDARAVRISENALYRLVFDRGLGYYTGATLDEQVERGTELIDKLQTHLPPDDILRAELLPQLESALQGWKDAEGIVTQSKSAVALARTAKNEQSQIWEQAMESAYGALVSRVGKKKAETFFPKARRSKPKKPSATAPNEGEPACEPSMGSAPSDATT